MGDDGNVIVPLPFPFPFYGQTFNNSWMYDNGVVSFKQPGTTGALNPGQWYSQPFSNQMNGSYFIAPLWADIAPKWGVTNYSTQTDGTYMKYNWSNISEYYSGGTRLSTFSLTIRPDGTFNTTYTGINLTTSNTSVGYVGDPTKSEYNQIYYAPAGTNIQTGTIANWSGATTPLYPPQCTTDPLYSTECPGYAQALALKNATTTTTSTPTTTTTIIEPTQITTTPTVVAAPSTTTTTSEPTTSISSTPISSPTISTTTSTPSVSTTASPTVNNPQPKVGEVAQSSGSTSKSNVSTSQILSIIATEQSRVSSVERSAVEQTTQQANAIASSVTQQAEAIASQSQSQSIATSVQTNQVYSQNAISGINGQLNILANATPIVNMAISNYGQLQNDQQNNNIGLRTLETQTTNENIVLASRNTQFEEMSRAESVKQTTPTPDRDLIEQNQVIQQESKQSVPASSVNQRVKDNELAGNVSIASIVRQPTGFELYMAAVPDVKFYDPKEIYRNQRNVDNARLLRGLTGGSDRLHQRMMEQQYR